MPSVADAWNSKPPLGAELASAVKDLSANQEIGFALYQRYVFPLDGMNYWIRVPSVQGTVTTPGLQMRVGLATATKVAGESVQVAPGGFGARNVVGGMIANPLNYTDQGLMVSESLFISITGPAASHAGGGTSELLPGESFELPAKTAVWVNAPSAGHKFTAVLYEAVAQLSLPTDIVVQGSLHYDSTNEQRVDATVDSNTVVFTSLTEVQPFNQISTQFLYIASYRDIRFAFSSRGYLYEQADLYHYVGKAIYSTTQTQIIDDINDFNPDVFFSDSTPIWMWLNYYQPPYPYPIAMPFPLYPSFLVDDNIPPPFGSVHIEKTDALAPVPLMGPRMQADQLCRDKVTIHMYGANNRMASDFRDYVETYSRDWNWIGIATPGAITDWKHVQSELKVIAQRKSLTIEVNYLQSVSRDLARQYIEAAKIAFYPSHGYDPGVGVNPYATSELSTAV